MSSPFTPLEIEKLTELRSKVKDILDPEKDHDDYFLIRWLRARNLDIPKAEEMLRKSLKWRKDNKVDGITENESIPDKYKKVYPSGLFGQDSEGNPVIIFLLGRYDHKIVIEAEGLPQHLRYNLIWVERIMQIVRDLEKSSGKKGLKLIEIVDMEYYSYKELMYKPGMEFIISSQKNFDENYPEMLKTLFIINAPKVFAILYGLVKPLMSKETLDKVDINGPDEEAWKEIIRQKFQVDKIPERWGGTLKGTNIFCSEDVSVWLDGPIPLDYFTRGAPDLTGFTTTKVAARDKLKLEYEIKNKQSELKWRFKTDNHDIGFQVTSPNGQILVPLTRADSQNTVNEGSIECQITGKYILLFDNSFSYTKSKTLYYLVEILDDLEEISLE